MKLNNLLAGAIVLAPILGIAFGINEFLRNRDYAQLRFIHGDRSYYDSRFDGTSELTLNEGDLAYVIPSSSDSDKLTRERLFVNGDLKWDNPIRKSSKGDYPSYISHFPMTKETQIKELPLGKNIIRYETTDAKGNINSYEAYINVLK